MSYDDDYTGPLNYDPEVPAGYQDADIEMAELEAAARYHSHMRKIGKCTHTWYQGLGADGQWHGEGPAPAPGQVFCFHCKEYVTDPYPDIR